ncbi:MAG TPA: response regulator [Solimonas sp.]|nr:response regulator [Solimonas sp.]
MPAQPAHILIVDDSASNRAVLRRAVADFGCEITETDNGATAVELALRHEYAVILLDIEMPLMDGFEVARQLRAFGRTGKTPLIFVTAAYTRPEHARYGYELGAADYLLAKPIDVEALRSATELSLHASLHGKDVTVVPDASIGIALHPEHGAERDELLKFADRAMYAIKQRGGGGIHLYQMRDAPIPQP